MNDVRDRRGLAAVPNRIPGDRGHLQPAGIGNDLGMTTDAGVERDDADSLCVFAPLPLLTVTVEHDVHEADQLHVHVGGQGIWIARMVRTLGMRPRSVWCLRG